MDYRTVNGVEWAEGYEEGERLGYKDAHEYSIEDAKSCRSDSWIAGFEEGYEYGCLLREENEK